MLARLRSHLTFANVASAAALFVALSTGGAYAANTVFSTDIVDGEVKTPDLATDAVTQAKLRDGAVGRPELANGGVSREKINNGAVDGSKVADNSLGDVDLGPNSVNTSELVDGGVGPADLSADARGARAYGHVNAGGGLDTSMSRNAEVNKPGAAPVYCVATTVPGVDSTNTPIVVSTTGGTTIGTATIHATDSINDDPLSGDFIEHSFAEWDGSNEVCPFGWYEVRTFQQFVSANADQLTVGGANKSFVFVIP